MQPEDLNQFTSDHVLAIVSQIVAKMLGSAVGSEQPLMEAGLDSLGAIELRESLQREFRMELPATLIFDYPSMATLSAYLLTQLSSGLVTASATGQVGSPPPPPPLPTGFLAVCSQHLEHDLQGTLTAGCVNSVREFLF